MQNCNIRHLKLLADFAVTLVEGTHEALDASEEYPAVGGMFVINFFGIRR